MRSTWIMGPVMALLGVTSAHADPLIGFTDTAPTISTQGWLRDTGAHWAVSWTQTQATHNVRLSALLSSLVGSTTADWYVTTALGPGTTAADVVHAGRYSLSDRLSGQNFNLQPRTLLGSGLDFAAGTYYLVLTGPAGNHGGNVEWVGGEADINLAPGFSLGSYYAATGTDAFAPAGGFGVEAAGPFVFEMEAVANVVPLPTSLSLAGLALLLLGGMRRARAG